MAEVEEGRKEQKGGKEEDEARHINVDMGLL
jgi:hypothetical protein